MNASVVQPLRQFGAQLNVLLTRLMEVEISYAAERS